MVVVRLALAEFLTSNAQYRWRRKKPEIQHKTRRVGYRPPQLAGDSPPYIVHNHQATFYKFINKGSGHGQVWNLPLHQSYSVSFRAFRG